MVDLIKVFGEMITDKTVDGAFSTISRIASEYARIHGGVDSVIEKEKRRLSRGIGLIAFENFTSFAVIEALGSPFANKYPEGMPENRYYGGYKFIDEIEDIYRFRALQVYSVDPEHWGVGSPTIFAAGSSGAARMMEEIEKETADLPLPSPMASLSISEGESTAMR